MTPGDRWKLRDVNGDGAADLLRIGEARLQLWINQIDGSFAVVRSLDWPALGTDEKVVFSDVNGNGTTDVLRVDVTGSDGWRYWDLVGQKPGLLQHFENGLGYTIDFAYTTVAAEAEAAAESGEPWAVYPPQPMPVLEATREHDGVDWVREVEHTLRDGWYDPERGEFRGFREVIEHRAGTEYAEARVTARRYDLGREEHARKLQLLRETVGAPGEVLTETTHSYEVMQQADGVQVSRKVATDVWHHEGRSQALSAGGSAQAPDARSDAQVQRVRTEWDYGAWGNVLEQRELGRVDPGTGADIPGDERITTHTYARPPPDGGPRDRVTETIVTGGEGNWASATRNYYDGEPEQGLPLGEVGARGALHRTETWLEGERWVPGLRQRLDAHGNVVQIRDAEGGTLQRTYDALGRFPIEERTLLDDHSPLDALVVTAEWDARFAQPTAVTDAAGATTKVAYDGLGRPIAIARPGDSLAKPTTAYRYHLDGSTPFPAIETELRRRHGTDEVERGIDQLDGLGRLRQRITQDDAGTGAVLSEARVYDPDGEIALHLEGQFVDAEALQPGTLIPLELTWPVTATWRDAAGRPVQTVDPDGYRTETRYGPLTSTHRDHEDLTGEAPYADTPQVTEVDGLGRTVAIRDELPDRTVTHRYTWDAADRLLRYQDPEGHTTHYDYRGDDALVTVDSPDTDLITQAFDDVGRLVERIDARGARVQWAFDVFGRVVHERGFDSQGNPDSEVTYHYDAPRDEDAEGSYGAGRLVAVDDDAGSLDYVHDARGRVVRSTRRFETGDGERTLSYGQVFDAQDRVIEEIFPDGSRLEHRYGYRGLEVGTGEFLKGVTYDALGRVVHAEYGNGVTQAVTLDRTGRVHEQAVQSGDATHLHLQHHYDAAGMLTRTDDPVGKTPVSPSLAQRFEYDNLHRLVAAQADYGELAWSYSDDGNLRRHAGRRLRYDGPHPHAATELDGQRLTYDDAGQLHQVDGKGPLPQGTWHFDSHGRVASFEHQRGAHLEHVYDHTGQRAIKRAYDDDGDLKDTVLYFGNVEVRDGKLIRWIQGAGLRIAESPTELPNDPQPLPLGEGALLGLVLLELLRRWPRTRQRRVRFRLPRVGASAPTWGSMQAFTSTTWPTRLRHGLARVLRYTRPGWAAALAMLIATLGLASCMAHGSTSGGLTVDKQTRFHIQGRLQSASLVLDHEGDVIARSAHRPYGEKWVDWQAKGHHAPDYRFTDKEDDTLSGATYIGARHYLPKLGRWASPDPLGRTAPERNLEQPRDANPFAYAAGNPVNAIDPNGLRSWLDRVSDAAAGFGDTITFGATDKVRDWMGTNDVVDKDSTSYAVGEAAGEEYVDQALNMATGGTGGTARKAARRVDKANNARKSLKRAKKAKKGKPKGCFVAGTLVMTAEGPRPIEEIEAGDLVRSRNPETGKEAWQPVATTFVRPDVPVLRLTDDAGTSHIIETTEEHPFWTRNQGWTKAGDLRLGTQVYTASGAWIRLTAATWLQPSTVYNFEVAEYHTYFVGDVEAWVHNTKCKRTEGEARDAVEESSLKGGHRSKGSKTGSNRPKHESGDARRNRDQGGEKADEKRRLPRKKPKGWKGPWPPKGS